MDNLRRIGLSLGVGLVAVVALRAVDPAQLALEPQSALWKRSVVGATPSGRVFDRAVVHLPGLRRAERGQIVVRVDGARVELRVGLDGERARSMRANREGEVVIELPARVIPSASLVLRPAENAPPITVRNVSVLSAAAPRWLTALGFVLTSLLVAALMPSQGGRIAAGVGLASAAFLAFMMSGALSSWLVPLGVLVASVSLGRASRSYWAATALAAAVIFGVWVRIYFLASAGTWDTEYWKGWIHRSVEHGTTRVYGDPDAVGPGELFDQLSGKTPVWRIPHQGRQLAVDYPPLAMVLWRTSWSLGRTLAPGLARGEAENVAIKLPPVLGDVLAVVLLLWIFRRERSRGIVFAALYWALPISWLSSAVMGFLDGAYAPFGVAALVAAAAGRPGLTGFLVAVAGLIKPQGLIMAPAAAVALAAAGAPIRRAFLVGLATVAAALVPFALAGTLDEAVVHVFRVLFQQRLSGGYANGWWLVGHLVSDEVYAPIEALAFPSRLVAMSAFVVATVFICWKQSNPYLAGGGLVFAYAMLALGVHHNHPHMMFLAFAASGLVRRRFSWIAGLLGVSYVLNVLCLEGLGRFYGARYMAVEPFAAAASDLRMAFGFDLTLLLAVVNVALFAAFLASLQRRG